MTMRLSEYQHSFDLSGRHVGLLIAERPGVPLGASVEALRVQANLQRLDRTLTPFDVGSELSRLNARAGTTVEVSPTLLEAIQAALYVARSSRGLVDPTVMADLERVGHDACCASASPVDVSRAIAAAPPRRAAAPDPAGAWQAIEIDPTARTVRAPAGVRIDLGGTAKGMALDIAAQLLAAHPTFAVHIGGDLRSGGTQPTPQMVDIPNPFHGDTPHEIVLLSGAVATCGLRDRVRRTRDGVAHHLIDPSSGKPAWTGVVQATALAPTALEAETLAKTAFLRGPTAARTVLAGHGGVLILDDGEVISVGRKGAASCQGAVAA